MNKKVRATAMVVFGLFPSLLFGQYYRMDADLQSSGDQKVLDRVFTGNTIGLLVNFYDSEEPFVVTNWNLTFRYGYSQYDTNGMVHVAGVNYTSNSVLFRSTTNLFFSENDNYYFSIVGLSTNGDRKTFARGRMIEEYDPGAAASIGYLSNGNWYVGWNNIYGDPASSDALVEYLSLTAGADAVARLAASNAQNTALSAYGLASNQPASASVWIWADAETNYYMKSADGSLNATGTSFSALLNSCLTPGWSGAAIELGPSRCADGSYVAYEIDAPITNSADANWNGFTLRGRGNYGSTISPKAGYTGDMFVITGQNGVVRFEDIRFQGGMANESENTNPVIRIEGACEFNVSDCEFGYFRGSAIRLNVGGGGLSWSAIRDCWFYGVRIFAGVPQIVYYQTNTSIHSLDFQIRGNHFYQNTNSPCFDVTGNLNFSTISDNDIHYSGSGYANATGLVLRSGYNYLIANNNFTHNQSGGHFIDFPASVSNDFRTLIVGNNTMGNATTNILHANTNAYSLVVTANRFGAGQTMTLGDNVGGYVLNDYGTTSAGAWRGDWGNAASNRAWSAWTNSLTNAAIHAAHADSEDAHGLDAVRDDATDAFSIANLVMTNSPGYGVIYWIEPAANIVIDPANGTYQGTRASAVAITNLTIGGSVTTNQAGGVWFSLITTNSVAINSPTVSVGTVTAGTNSLIYSKTGDGAWKCIKWP